MTAKCRLVNLIGCIDILTTRGGRCYEENALAENPGIEIVGDGIVKYWHHFVDKDGSKTEPEVSMLLKEVRFYCFTVIQERLHRRDARQIEKSSSFSMLCQGKLSSVSTNIFRT